MFRAIPLVLVMCVALLSQAEEPNTLWDITLHDCSGVYRVTVAAHEDYTTLDISYTGESGKSIAVAHHKGERGFLYAWPISVLPSGVVAVWSCGTGVCTTVFPLVPEARKPVFDEWSESAPEFIGTDAGQLMLFYSGKHYLNVPSQLSWEPRQAALYLWTADQYKLIPTVLYQQRFTALAKVRSSNVPRGSASPCHN